MSNKISILIVIGFFIIALAGIFLRNEPLMRVPTERYDVYANMASSSDQTKTVKLMQDAQIVNALESNTAFTVFAPTDDAYAKLAPSTIQDFQTGSNFQIHAANNHLVLGNYPTATFYNGMQLTSVNAEILTITNRNGRWYVNNAPIIGDEIISKNGVTHAIDGVLLPNNL